MCKKGSAHLSVAAMWRKVGVDCKTTRSYSPSSHRPPLQMPAAKTILQFPKSRTRWEIPSFSEIRCSADCLRTHVQKWRIFFIKYKKYFATLPYYVGPHIGIKDQWEKEGSTLQVTFNSNTWFIIQQQPRHPKLTIVVDYFLLLQNNYHIF